MPPTFPRLSHICRKEPISAGDIRSAPEGPCNPNRDVQPFGRRVYDAFGPKRLLFGTGMVGATRRIPLADELRLIREDIPYFTAGDKPWILGRNALSIWKWPQA